MDISAYMRALSAITVLGPDGEPLCLGLRAPCDPARLAFVEVAFGRHLPEDYRAFLLSTDGCNLFGLNLMPAAEVHALDHGLLAFHNWGNGDFDAIMWSSIENRYSVVFVNHNPEHVVRIAASFSDWLSLVMKELLQSPSGEILHPRDYRVRSGEGAYAHVLAALAGRDCELNRNM